MTKLEREIELEKTVLEKMNCLLEHHWSKTRTQNDFYFDLIGSNSSYEIIIHGACLGRRLWKDLLQVVNAFADNAVHCSKIDIYKPFKGLDSKSLEELAIKIDLALQDVNRSDGLHKYRILCSSSS